MAFSTGGWLTDLKDQMYDAQANLYYAKFTSDDKVNVNSNTAVNHLGVRCKGFTPPIYEQKVNSVKYLTAGVDLPMAAFQTSNKEFKITFRLDANYDVYKYLMDQQKITSKPSSSAVAVAVNSTMTVEIFVYASAEAGYTTTEFSNISEYNSEKFTSMFKFSNCWVKSITGINYNYQNAAPMEVTATFGFLDYTDASSLVNAGVTQ